MTDLLDALVLPSNVCFLLTVIGVALSLSARTRRASLITLAAAGIVLVIFSSGKTAAWLTSSLEYTYPRAPDQLAPVHVIVILASYAANDPDMSLGDRPNSSALYRVVEGALLWKRCDDCRVIVTGASPTTDVMAELLVAMGVPSPRVELDSHAVNTAASAANVSRLTGDAPFYLVTSAAHLPRAMAALAAVGARPLPAPTDHQLPRRVAQASWRLTPFHMQASDLAVHERIGMWWYRVRGLI
jgi:uncharacterized SAM-binding protein YcdF (DUF218 family)